MWAARHQRAIMVLAAVVIGVIAWQWWVKVPVGNVAQGVRLRLDPNVASAEELEAIPGMGPARARAVVGYREGGEKVFRSVEDLEKVRGFGRGVVGGMERYLKFPEERK